MDHAIGSHDICCRDIEGRSVAIALDLRAAGQCDKGGPPRPAWKESCRW